MILKNLTEWELAGFWTHVPLQGVMMETGMAILPVTPWIKAKVPGGIHKDLLDAGLISDPYFELNSITSEWVNQRWWIYKTEFEIPDNKKRFFLVFKGIDYKAHIYLNSEKIAEHEGMNTECRIEITKTALRNSKNDLRVVIENAPDEMAQIGYTSKTKTQKARFGYKWDFSTRIINLGLYDSTFIEMTDSARIEEVYTRYNNNEVSVNVWLDNSADIRAEFGFEGDIQEQILKAQAGKNELKFKVNNPKLWWPNGYGSQPLYDLKIECISGNEISDERNYKVGLRTFEYERCEGAPEDSLPYIIKVNGVKIPMKGVNITPLDHLYGTVTDEHYEDIVRLSKEANVNLIRVWGGGIIEKEIFYDLCDRYGFLVWQDFIQSSSGIDNIPSEDEHFLELLSRTAETAVKEKRNHACMAVWCGGNELTDENNVPCTVKNKNVAMLEKIVREHDLDTLFLPTTSSGPNFFYIPEPAENNHDIHGPWKYFGEEEHYRYFNTMNCLLLGECGNDGMTNMSALERILSKDNLKMTTMEENRVWAHHGQTWDTYIYRDKGIFGEFSDLEEFIKISQYMQAEGLRKAIESQRRKLPETAGINIWQLNEPWPNVSCTCLVDYYRTPKFAYNFMKEAYKTFHVAMRYNKLLYKKGETFEGEVFVIDEKGGNTSTVNVRILNNNKECIYSGNEKKFSFRTEKAGNVFYVECEAANEDNYDKNVYMFFVVDEENPYADRKAVIEFVDEYRR